MNIPVLFMSAALSTATVQSPVDSVTASLPPLSYEVPAYVENGSSAAQVTLSLEECIRAALSDNPTVKVAEMEVTRTDYSRKEILASLFPSIDFSGAYQRTIKLQSMRMDFAGQSQTIKVGSDNMWNFGFSAQMPLVSPTLWKSISLADTQILASLEQSRSSKLDLVNQVSKAYYALMLAIASRDVIRENYELALFNASLYEKQFAAGTASEYDVLRSSVQVKNVEPELLQADIAVKQCRLQLCVLMGIMNDLEIVPDLALADYHRDMYGYPADSDTSISDNPQLRTLDIQSVIADKNIDLKKFAWLPTLGASFNFNWNALSNGNALKNQEFTPYSTVGLALSIPIFSGGAKYNALRQAKIQRKELELQRENLVNSLSSQVQLAIDNINRQAAQISTSSEGVRQAEKAHGIMQRSFEIGAASYLDLRDSEVAETASKLAYYQSIYNYLVSTADLDLLLGRGL